MKKIRRIFIVCLMIMVCSCQPAYVSAAKKGSISISYPCSNTTFQLYYVASMTKTSQYKLKKRFSKYPIQLNKHTKDEWMGQAQALEAYIHRDQLRANRTGDTDNAGEIKFTDLRRGLYLIMAKTKEENGYIYKAMPYFISIPGKSVNGKAQYNITSAPKYEKTPTTQDQKTDCKVVKTWVDKNHENKRPKKIVVQLLQDGKIYQEVSLSKENNWQYTWKDLSQDHQWEAVEKSKSGDYFASVSKQGTSFVIKNIYWDEEYYKDSKKPKKPGKKKIKTTEEYYQDSNKPKKTKTKTTKTSKTTKLPQTGQLWWPLPFLMFGGIICIGIGMMSKKRENYEKEE